MSESQQQTLERIAGYVLSRARSIVPLTHGVTIIIHEHADPTEWHVVSTVEDAGNVIARAHAACTAARGGAS